MKIESSGACPPSEDRPSLRARPAVIRRVYIWTLIGAIAWIAAIFAAPLLMRASPPWARLWYAAFSPVCHQDPARCFVLDGYPLAVCGRCLGIYLGFLAGLAVYPALRGLSRARAPSLRTLIVFSIPIGADALGNLLGLWRSPNVLRFATGSVWGLLLPFFWVSGLADAFSARRAGTAPRQGPSDI